MLHRNHLHPARRTGFNGYGAFGTPETIGDELDELLIRLAVYGRGFQLGDPNTIRSLLQG